MRVSVLFYLFPGEGEAGVLSPSPAPILALALLRVSPSGVPWGTGG